MGAITVWGGGRRVWGGLLADFGVLYREMGGFRGGVVFGGGWCR